MAESIRLSELLLPDTRGSEGKVSTDIYEVLFYFSTMMLSSEFTTHLFLYCRQNNL